MDVSRRFLLAATGAASAAASAFSAPIKGGMPAAAGKRHVCFLVPDVVDGPYYDNHAIVRSDIT